MWFPQKPSSAKNTAHSPDLKQFQPSLKLLGPSLNGSAQTFQLIDSFFISDKPVQ